MALIVIRAAPKDFETTAYSVDELNTVEVLDTRSGIMVGVSRTMVLVTVSNVCYLFIQSVLPDLELLAAISATPAIECAQNHDHNARPYHASADAW